MTFRRAITLLGVFFLTVLSLNCGQNPFGEPFFSVDNPTSCSKTADCPGAMICQKGTCTYPTVGDKSSSNGTKREDAAEPEEEDCYPFCDGGDVTRECFPFCGEEVREADGATKESNTEKLPENTGEKKCTKEVCDKRDNDCDGVIDEGCPCYYRGKKAGPCKEAKINSSGECEKPRYYSDKELCDGRDNNCDGSVDEGCQCTPGAKRSCGIDTGECEKGEQTCNNSGQWGPCQGSVGPKAETCNGKDDDCDGKIDETFPEAGKPCKTGKPGACANGKFHCTGGKLSCAAPRPAPEVCNGKDDDCDGQVDETFPEAGKPCKTGKPGDCAVGKYACDGGKLSCNPPAAGKEDCNGKDDDCDGLIDENCPCNYKGSTKGVCSKGQKDGKGGCLPPPTYSATEKCGDKLDNNCDGYADEGCPCYYLGKDKGVCATAKTDKNGNCLRPKDFSYVEKCDGVDNDCDGYVDNIPNTKESLYQSCYSAPKITMGWGYCRGGKKLCSNGKWGGCLLSVVPAQSEVCGNGLDDNCDGVYSENCKMCPIYKRSQFHAKLQGGVFPHSIAAVKPGTEYLAVGAGNYSGTVKIWWVRKGSMYRTYSLPSREKAFVTALAFDPSPKNKILAIGLSDSTVRLYSYEYQKESLVQILYLPSQPYSIDFFPDGVHVGVGTAKGFYVFTRYSGTPRYALRHSLAPSIAKLSSKGKYLAMIRGSKVYLWAVGNYQRYRNIATITPPERPQSILFTASEKELVIAGKNTVYIWNIASQKLKKFVKISNVITSVDVDPSEKYLAVTGDNLLLTVWGFSSAKQIASQKLPGYSSTAKGFKPIVKFISDADFVVISSPKNKYNSFTQNILYGKTPDFEYNYIYRSPEILDALAVSDSGSYTVTGDQKGNLYFWHLSSLKPKNYTLRKNVVLPNSGVRDLEYLYSAAPQGGLKSYFFISAHSDGYLRIWSHAGILNRHFLISKSFYPRRLDFHRKSSLLAVGISSGAINIYKVTTSVPPSRFSLNLSYTKTLKGHTSYINSVAFNFSGDYLISSSLDGTVIVWDVGKGVSVKTIKSTAQNPMKIPRTVVTHPTDSQLFAFAEDGGYIYFWKIGGSAPTLKIKVGSTIKDIFIEPGGKYIFALIDIKKTILVYEIGKGTLVNTIYTEGYPSRIKYLNNKFGQFIYTNYNFPVLLGCP